MVSILVCDPCPPPCPAVLQQQSGAGGPGGELSLSRELLAGDRSFASSRELGGGGLSFDDPDDRGGLTMSGEMPRWGLSGMSVGMSAEVPRGGLGGLSVEVPKGSAVGAPGTSTELEVSGLAGGPRMGSSMQAECTGGKHLDLAAVLYAATQLMACWHQSGLAHDDPLV